MATKMNKYDRTHLSNLSKYQRQIDTLYRRLIQEAAQLGAAVDGLTGEELFAFDNFPTLKKRAERLLNEMHSGMSTVIVNGVNAEWTLANNKNSELARTVFGDNVGKLSQAQYRKYFSTNDKAREAFLARKEAGLNLSDRVWRYTNQFKGEIELGLDVGIRNGMSAAEMARELKAWLREPDKLFRRVRDEHGDLQPSRAMAAYHPGQGVYRSSYKNARRLAATETNIAYRTADYERWQELPFVVGIEVVLSNNHPEHDICDELKGRYPKDFKFTGWHPHCRCHAVSVLKTEEEIEEDTRRILNGEDPTTGSTQTVSAVPQGFVDWVKDNSGRIERAKSLPYFLSDNRKFYQTQSITVRKAETGGTGFVATVADCSNFLVKGATDSEFFNSFSSVYDDLVEPTADNWVNASQNVRRALINYTATSYHTYNSVARGVASDTVVQQYGQTVKEMEEFISKCKTKRPMALKRGTDAAEIDGIFGKGTAEKIFKGDKSVVGATGKQDSFISTAFNAEGGFDDDFEIWYYVPKNSEVAALFPVSPMGWNQGVNWNGKNPGYGVNKIDENEMLINKGYRMKLIGFETVAGVPERRRLFIQLLDRE